MGSLSTSCQRARRSASALALAHRARPSVERENTRRRLHRSLLHYMEVVVGGCVAVAVSRGMQDIPPLTPLAL